MLQISFKPSFVRQINKLEKDLITEVMEKIELFKDTNNHKVLKVHKLHGRLSDYYSFYVNYKVRVVFMWKSTNEATLIVLGDHDVYK